ncbi:flagellar motor switch protein FliG [Shimia gijangensis]|uniref:Flagellar motor switch protein FliG n=1 Tax=Shimia gijangensis TaxID=1470563 RepID=A0A1M6EAJ7_9RHOB|nr:FliG C-terminal domain-containing protein [Shimia gijangensis]SHI82506.1 flagellar motor switch protein FliG [Shimia gijangensis]
MSSQIAVGQLAPPPARPQVRLGRRQKATIIVRFLLNEGADLALSDLPEDLQVDLTQMMGEMRHVDRDTLAHELLEFAGELETIGLSFPRGITGALSALEGRISPYTAARLRKEAGVRQTGDPWKRLQNLAVEDLIGIIDSESTEVAAVMLSKLDVAKAAELLGNLPGEKARRITYAVSLTGAVTPEAVDRIGVSLAAQLDDIPPRAFSEEPVARVGAILNYSPTSTRDDVLSGLEETDAGFASAVRKAIFTYADIPQRVAPRDVPRVVREVDQTALVTALTFSNEGYEGLATEFLLENMSTRLADQLREEVEDRGTVVMRDGEAAQTAVVAVVRLLVDGGEIQLIEPQDDDDISG